MNRPALFTTITSEHWRHALPMARARRREQRAVMARRIREIVAASAAARKEGAR